MNLTKAGAFELLLPMKLYANAATYRPMVQCRNGIFSRFQIFLWCLFLLCSLSFGLSQEISSIRIPPDVHPTWFNRTLLLHPRDSLDPYRFWESEYWIRRTQLFPSASLLLDSIAPFSYQLILKAKRRPIFTALPRFWLSSGYTRFGVQFAAATTSNPAMLATYHLALKPAASKISLLHSSTLQFFGLSSLYLIGSLSGKYADSLRNFHLVLRRPIERSDITFGFHTAITAVDDYYPLNQRWLRRARSRLFTAIQFDVGDPLPLYFTVATLFQKSASHSNPLLTAALDQTWSLILGLTSLRQEFADFQFLNDFTPILPTGASGTVIFGKTFAIDSTAIEMLYIGGRAEEGGWLLNGKLYLYAMAAGGSGFHQGEAVFTYQESEARLQWHLTPKLFLRMRYRHQIRWNWRAFAQLFLDETTGLRGYPYHQLAGENRLVSATEIHHRLALPILRRASLLLFADLGTVWNQGERFFQQPFFAAIGGGIHAEYALFSLPNFLRLEIGYALRRRQWFFSIATHLPFAHLPNIQPPAILFPGMESDVQPME